MRDTIDKVIICSDDQDILAFRAGSVGDRSAGCSSRYADPLSSFRSGHSHGIKTGAEHRYDATAASSDRSEDRVAARHGRNHWPRGLGLVPVQSLGFATPTWRHLVLVALGRCASPASGQNDGLLSGSPGPG